jgi:hypothetical protein
MCQTDSEQFMSTPEEKATTIYAASRKELDASMAAARNEFATALIAISDECEHHNRLWSFKFIKPVHGSFGEATVQIRLVYGQIPYMDKRVPIGLGYAAVAPQAGRTCSGQRQVEFAEIRAKDLYTVVAEAIEHAVREITV